MEAGMAAQAGMEHIPLLLLVDDAPDQIATLTHLLSGNGWEIESAGSGQAALEAMHRRKPDLVLLDVVMPGMDGLEVMRQIRNDPGIRDLPVLFITGRTDPRDIAAGFEIGASDYIVKPFNGTELLARVRLQLALKQGRDRERHLIADLQKALGEVKQLSGLIPICAHCKKIRNDDGFWQQVEHYISSHSDALFSHGMCPECIPLYFPDFPVGQSGLATPVSQRPDPVVEHGNPVAPKILIVDDDPSQIRAIVPFMREEGYTLLVATDGPGALETVNQESPDLILLDVMMPGMDGLEVCRRLRDDPRSRQVPVIFVTGRSEETDEMAGFDLGAVDYITKPFSLPRVRARVRTQLELKRHRDILEHQSMRDSLTGMPSRRAFLDFMELMWRLAIRQRSPISVIILDVDHFKVFNDAFGHLAGDECLRRVARCLQGVRHRSTDLVARYGGEGFVCILPGTDLEGAWIVAENLRVAVDGLALPHAHSAIADHVTVSLGVACSQPRVGETSAALLEAADQALCRARQGGGNRVET